MTEPTVLDHVLAGLLTAGLLFAVLRSQPKLKDVTWDTAAKISMYWSNGAVLWLAAIAVGVVWVLAGRPLSDLGLTWSHASPGAGVAIAVAFVTVFTLYSWNEIRTPARRERLIARLRGEVPFLPETSRELAHFAFLSITAGVTEEIIFRGYVISYVGWFTGSSPLGVALAVTIPAILFGIAHRYQRWSSRLLIVGMALAMGAIFVITGSLLLPIVLHALVDIASGTLVRRVSDAANRPCTS